jgi:hypothetical protein
VNSPVVLTARALLFDMDGTLIDSTAVVESVWARFATRYGIDVREILETSHGRQMVDTVRRWAPAGTDIAAECLELSSFEITQTEGIVSLPGASSFANALPRQTRALVTSAPRELAVARMSRAARGLPRRRRGLRRRRGRTARGPRRRHALCCGGRPAGGCHARTAARERLRPARDIHHTRRWSSRGHCHHPSGVAVGAQMQICAAHRVGLTPVCREVWSAGGQKAALDASHTCSRR